MGIANAGSLPTIFSPWRRSSSAKQTVPLIGPRTFAKKAREISGKGTNFAGTGFLGGSIPHGELTAIIPTPRASCHKKKKGGLL